MKNQKTLVYTLILLLTATGTLSLFMPAQAETWTDITLPYTITQSGNYRISGAFNGSGTALSINSSNVVVDGQNKLLSFSQAENDIAVAIAPNSRNVLIKNLNETGADYGVYAKEGNFTITDSLLTNNNSTAIFAFNVTSFTIKSSRTSNNTYGIVTIDCSNFTVNDCHIKNNTKGLVTVLGERINVQSSYFNNNTEAISAQNCTNLQLDSNTLVENEVAINATYTSLSVNNLSVSDNLDFGIKLSYSNLTACNFECKNNVVGLYSLYSNFSAANSSLSNNFVGGIMSGYGNATLLDCAIDNNTMYGAFFMMNNNTKIDNCGIKNNEYGIAALDNQNFLLTDSLIFNNSFTGLLEELGSNTRLAHNNFTQNGLDEKNMGFGSGALIQVETNCTVTDNVFKNNYDSLLLGSFDQEIVSTQIYQYNTFENNSYTFDFNYNLASNVTNHKVHFYNNYVNDVGYVNPISFGSETQVPPAANVLYLNTTLQAGRRVNLDGGRMIGGNYWAHPNGTGPSQTAADTDHNGFLDSPFDLFGNNTVMDYLPYSSSFQEKVINLSIFPQSATIKAGQALNYTATAADEYGNQWNVTADYTVNGNPFSGALSIVYVGTYSIQASYGGKTADATLTIASADVDHYIVVTPEQVTPGSPFAIRVVAVDKYTNIVTDCSSAVSLTANGSSITPSTSGSFSYGIWTGNVTVTESGAFTISVADGSGHSGISSTLNAEAATEPTPTPTPTPTVTPTTQPTANPTDNAAVSDSYWWAWYVVPLLAIAVSAATIVYLLKYSSKKPEPK